MSSVAAERRPPSQLSFAPPPSSLTTIINDNEFPTLGARGTPSSGGFSPLPTTSTNNFSGGQSSQSPLLFKDSASSSLGHRNYVVNMTSDGPAAVQDPMRVPNGVWAQSGGISMMIHQPTLMRGADPSLTNPEFQIQSEDFPALPGAIPGSDLVMHAAPVAMLNAASDMLTAASQGLEGSFIGGSKATGEPPRGIVTNPEGEVSNIPASMLADQFGMAGLVTYLRTVDNPSIVSLALGYDLTTLGLNLNLSERHLYETFGGPWAETAIRPHELDVRVPEEYLTNAHVREKLPPVKLNKLSEDVLFYLFYNCPGEVYQLAAACELYTRDWRFHKSDGMWLTRSQYGGVKEQTTTYEKGQYNVFDPLQWRKIPKELKLEYKELEERPKLPAVFGATGTLPTQRPAS